MPKNIQVPPQCILRDRTEEAKKTREEEPDTVELRQKFLFFLEAARKKEFEALAAKKKEEEDNKPRSKSSRRAILPTVVPVKPYHPATSTEVVYLSHPVTPPSSKPLTANKARTRSHSPPTRQEGTSETDNAEKVGQNANHGYNRRNRNESDFGTQNRTRRKSCPTVVPFKSYQPAKNMGQGSVRMIPRDCHKEEDEDDEKAITVHSFLPTKIAENDNGVFLMMSSSMQSPFEKTPLFSSKSPTACKKGQFWHIVSV